MKIFSLSEVNQQFRTTPDPKLWTAVIPAAGRGSRLGYDKPKILYPIAGRPILDWLIDLLEPACSQIVFVLSPTGEGEVAPVIKKRLGKRSKIAIQPEPKGMADAIYHAADQLVTPQTLVIWGDQVGIRPKTLDSLQKLHQGAKKASLTLPLVSRPDPYVHYQTNKAGRLVNVLHKREGDPMPESGLADCGLFALDTPELKNLLSQQVKQGVSLTGTTKEWNFVPLFPKFETAKTTVHAFILESLEETVGVNDAKDVAILEQYFKTRT